MQQVPSIILHFSPFHLSLIEPHTQTLIQEVINDHKLPGSGEIFIIHDPGATASPGNVKKRLETTSREFRKSKIQL